VANVISLIPWLYKGLGLDERVQQFTNWLSPIPEDEDYQLQRNERNDFISKMYDHLQPIHARTSKFTWLDDLEKWTGDVLSDKNVIADVNPINEQLQTVYKTTTLQEPVWNPPIGGV